MLLVGLGLAGCLPPEPVQGLLRQPIVLGLRTEVVRPGPYAEGLVVPEEESRADVLPLDTVALEWVTIGPDGPATQAPVWLACQRGWACERALPQELAACAEPLPLMLDAPCVVGTGTRVEFTLDDADDPRLTYFDAQQTVVAVGSGDPELSPETCLGRLQARPLAELEDCLIARGTLRLGPLWHLLPQLELPWIVTLTGILPAEARADAANFHPRLAEIRVQRGAMDEEVVADGGAVQVGAGERVKVTFEPEEDAKQVFHTASFVGPVRFFERTEGIGYHGYTTVPVVGFERAGPGLAFRFVVPDEFAGGDLLVWLYDGRGGGRLVTLHMTPEPT